MSVPSPLRGAIVAMNSDHIIGLDNKLPWHYSADLKRFKQRTLGKVIIMGRRTWESIGSKSLPDRRNIVISRHDVQNVECYKEISKAIAQCEDRDVWIIGGSQIYHGAFEYLNLLDVTMVPDIVDDDGTVHFPDINPTQWKLLEQQPLAADPRLTNMIYIRR